MRRGGRRLGTPSSWRSGGPAALQGEMQVLWRAGQAVGDTHRAGVRPRARLGRVRASQGAVPDGRRRRKPSGCSVCGRAPRGPQAPGVVAWPSLAPVTARAGATAQREMSRSLLPTLAWATGHRGPSCAFFGVFPAFRGLCWRPNRGGNRAGLGGGLLGSKACATDHILTTRRDPSGGAPRGPEFFT